MTGRKIIILDRDGVINQESDVYVKSADEWVPISGSLEAIAKLSKAGYSIYVATNQAGVGRGIFTLKILDEIHKKMRHQIEVLGGSLEEVFFCPHLPEDNCACRKPKPGLLLLVANACDSDLKGVPFVGDSLRDMQAAMGAGASPILVRTGFGEITKGLSDFPSNIPIFKDLAAYVEDLLRHEN
mgnify:CR=1 FL=1